MRYTHFDIQNFKGISSARIDLAAHPRGNVYTLVGLNESGKTTVLEALNFLDTAEETLDPLGLSGYAIKDPHDLIPISQRGNFNGAISVTVGCEPNADDLDQIRSFLKGKGFTLTGDIRPFEISHIMMFENSKLVQNYWNWPIEFTGLRRGSKKKEVTLKGDESPTWDAATDYIRDHLLPSVLYFPNFLFDFPDKIYLESPPVEKEKHKYYCTILQDVLDSLNDGIELQKHIVERMKSNDKNDRRALESVLTTMGGHIAQTVSEQWSEMFGREVGRRDITIAYDQDEDGSLYLQLKLKDGSDLYDIGERSLGFRWFFAFLLLTKYRGFRKNAPESILFLFDEPASNLHASAQAQLLRSFGNFPSTCSVIYTTHSHYMINPEWLEGTFVVKNEGLTYESGFDEYSKLKSVVTLQRYREFAAKHPNQSTYFTPILEVLAYKPSNLENVPDVIMLEGKNDFYTLKYFHEKVFEGAPQCNFMPGGGAGSLDNLIRLYIAWGRQFIVLLDSDGEGQKQKDRYEELFGAVVKGRIFTLADIDPAWSGKGLEDILTPDDRQIIQSKAYPDTTEFNKTHFNRAVQELYLTDEKLSLSETSVHAFEKLLEFLKARLAAAAKSETA